MDVQARRRTGGAHRSRRRHSPDPRPQRHLGVPVLRPKGAILRLAGDRALAAVFAAVIFLPIAGEIFHLDRSRRFRENRVLAARPALAFSELEKFPARYEAFVNDRFGFRNRLIRWHHKLRRFAGVPRVPEVAEGGDGWLFLVDGTAMDDYEVTRPISPAALAEWAAILENERRWLAGRGTRFLVVFVPNKLTAYSDYLPPYVRRLREETRLDQLVAYLRAHTGLDILDLRPVIARARKDADVFYRYDTHWNALGAFIGFREIVARLRPHFPRLPEVGPGSHTVTPTDSFECDLLDLRGESRDSATHYVDTDYVIEPRGGRRAKVVRTRKWPKTPNPRYMYNLVATRHPDDTLPRAAVFHDSFGKQFIPHFAECFSRAVFRWQFLIDRETVEEVDADVVILEMLEHALILPPTVVLGPLKDSAPGPEL